MKTYITTLLMAFLITGCFAQTPLREGKFKGKRDSFKVANSSYTFNNEKRILVSSTKNIYDKGIPQGKNEIEMGPKDIHIDQELIKTIIKDVLSNKIEKLHKRHEKIRGNLIFDPSGNITDVNFSVLANTIITPIEFEAIDNRFRTEVKATYTGKAYLTYVAINGYYRDIEF